MIKKQGKLVFKISYICVLLLISVFALIGYSNILEKDLSDLVRNTLKEVSVQNVLVIQKEIEGELNALEEIAERLGALDDLNEEKIVTTLKSIMDRYSFKRMGFCRPDGMAYLTDDRVMDITGRPFFENSMEGKNYISKPLMDSMDGEEIIVFSTPVKSDGEIIGVVYASYQVESLREILSVTSFEGEGYTYIVQSDGSKVVDSINPTSFQNMTNIYKSMEEADYRNTKAVEQLTELLENNKTGYVIFYNKIGKYMYATPLGINDWFLIQVVPVDFMESTSRGIMIKTYLTCAVLIAVCIVIAVILFWEERKKKQQMQNMLYMDALTGGDTLAKFKMDAEWKVKYHYETSALIVMDLDDFKLINELFGSEEGDRVLCDVWEVLHRSCKDGECVGRNMADRFVMLLYFEKREEIEQRIMEITDEIQHISIPNASEYILHPAFGVYYVEENVGDVSEMLDCAFLAHNILKQERDGIYKVYTEDMKEKILQKKQLSDQIEHACDNHEFVVYYQPKYESSTQKLAGAEALVRWKKPDGQMVSPGVFIPLAEESGFVRKLDEYIFKEVCYAQKRWLDQGYKIVPVSVNLSRRHLENPEFIDEYKRILDESGLPIEYVQLELTESAMFEKKEETIDIMEKLHGLGFMILMDDFGTGYSSLMMLKSVPVDVMKLDKSFVDDYNDERGEQIIRCVMRMAQELRIAITAEGVETEEQFNFLKGIGCDTIQGFYFARPMPEEEYEKCMERVFPQMIEAAAGSL